jgi:hypothetical protein
VNIARSRLDIDDEHRREAQRRMDVAKLCKQNIEVFYYQMEYTIFIDSISKFFMEIFVKKIINDIYQHIIIGSYN